MMDRFKRLVFLPVIVSNLYSMFGVLFLGWSVADIFFWFWCEFVLSGITSFVFLMAWLPIEKKRDQVIARMAGAMPFMFGFAFLYLLFFATLFAAVAYKGEWHGWGRFPRFLADKEIGLAAIIATYAFVLVRTFMKRDRGYEDSKTLAQPFNKKCFALVGFYMLYLIHGWITEWVTGARSLNLSPEYLKGMGVTLLSLKLMGEAGLFDRFFKRRPKIF
jgi:Family of unknown function (DUF6498)